MQLIDEKVYEDHFVEVTLKERDWNILLRDGELKQKVSCNGEIISLAIIVELDKSPVEEDLNRQEKKIKYRY